MMRRFILYFCIAIFISFSGCHSANLSPYNDVNSISNISMIIDSIDYESNQVTLSIVNESDYTFTYDSVYYVETKKDSDWYTLNPDQYFDALGYVLPPNSSIELTIELEDVLKTGEHRIVKSVSVEQHTYYLSSTFIVP